MQTLPQRERGLENKEVFLIYGDKKKRVSEKRGRGERAARACFACTGASAGEGVDRAPQCCLQLSDNSCSERRDVLRVLRHVSLFLHLPFHLSASPSRRTDVRQTHVPTHCLPHARTHPSLDDTHTHTQFRSVCTGDSYVIGRLPRAQRRALEINQVKLNFRWNLCC